MFWKKKIKTGDETPKPFIVPHDNRKAFRISPANDDPVYLDIDNKNLEVVDISSGGVSFRNSGFKGGETFDVQFSLPMIHVDVDVKLTILRIGDGNICHGQFVDLPTDLEDKIHKYVLDRQKEDLRFSADGP